VTRQTVLTNPNTSSDAQFRAWGSAISAAITAAGLAKTADTGQIDWATVTKPATATTVAGYEIRKFGDSLATSRPVYLKLSYGLGGSTGINAAGITAISIGTGSDGAGNLTGQIQALTSFFTASSSNNPDNVNSTSYVTHGEGFLTLVVNRAGYGGGVGSGMVLVLDRTRDSAGAPTTEGLYIAVARASATLVFVSAYAMNYVSGVNQGPIGPVAAFPDLASFSTASEVYVFPHLAFLPAIRNVLAAVTYNNADITAATTFTSTVLGATPHTYLALGATAGNAGNNQSTSGANSAALNEGNACLAVLWED